MKSSPSSRFSHQVLAVCSKALGRKTGISVVSRLAFQHRQARRRSQAEKRGEAVPPVLIASITRKCNLSCAGCYARSIRPGTEKRPELSDQAFFKLFSEARDLGVGVILLAGGEPLMRLSLLKAASGMKGLLFPVFSNATLFNESSAALFGGKSSLIPVFSIEGSDSNTADRRGGPVPEAVHRAIDLTKAQKGIFGLSITLTSANADLVLSADFLRSIRGLGASGLFLVEYVPVEAGTEWLCPSQKQSDRANDPRLLAGLGLDYEFPVITLPGDESWYGGCLAAGRGFAHISPEGDLEACPFAPISDSNAAKLGLAAALASPTLAAIRAHHDELVETRGGCALRGKAEWISAISGCKPAVLA